MKTDRETVIRNLISGEYSNPVRIVAFNTDKGWSRDVTAEIAREIRDRDEECRPGCVISSNTSCRGQTDRRLSAARLAVPVRMAAAALAVMELRHEGSPHGSDGSNSPRLPGTRSLSRCAVRGDARPDDQAARVLLRDPKVDEAMAALSPGHSPSIVPSSPRERVRH